MYFWKYILAKKAGLSQKKCNMALYGLPVLPIAEAFEKTVTGNPISISDALAQDALSLQVAFTPTQDGTPSIDSEPTTEPYLNKIVPRGNKEYYSLVGGTVAWNQLVDQVHVTGLVNGLTRSDASHDDIKAVRIFGECTVGTNYTVFRSGRSIENKVCLITLGNVELPTGSRLSLSSKDKTTTVIYKSPYARIAYELYVENGVSIDVTLYPQIFDLTDLFSSSIIADYIYSLEQATEGAGVQWLKDYGFFTEDYYPYNPGELNSVNTSGHKTVGFNQWDEKWEVGRFNENTGVNTVSTGDFRTKNYINVFPGVTYYIYQGDTGGKDLWVMFFDSNYNVISDNLPSYTFYGNCRRIRNIAFVMPNNCHYIRFFVNGSNTYRNDICINISDPQKNGTYKPYVTNTYPIDNIDLRGLFKMSNGKLYCEGDIYPPSGSVARNFEYRAYQSGDESLADAITDGTHTVVKLTTPTTESATPYTSPIDVEAGGTEEFIDNRTVPIPVGNETYYASEYEIHGKTGVTVSHGATQDDPNPTKHEVEFTSQGTVYGGTVDIVSGELSVTWGYIASYNGETLTGIWMSSKDVYAEGTTPSTGAEVAYELATPQTYNLTPEQVQMLLGDNYLETEDGTITLTYMAGK